MRSTYPLLITFCFTLLIASCKDGGTDATPNTYNVQIAISPTGSGTIHPSADSTYEEGSAISLEADPVDGYDFVEWTGDIDSTVNPLPITVNSNYSLTANFRERQSDSVRFEFSMTGNGTMEVNEQEVDSLNKLYKRGTELNLRGQAGRGWYLKTFNGDTSNFDELGYFGASQIIGSITLQEDTELKIIFEEGFNFGDTTPLSTVASSAQKVNVFDFDGDGDNDLVVSLTYDYTTGSYWLENTGGLSFNNEKKDLPGRGIYETFFWDFDNDGDKDLITDREGIYENKGGGNFEELDTRSFGLGLDEGVGPFIDMDSDGYKDIVYFDGQNDEVGWYKNQAGESTSKKKIITNTSSDVAAVGAADLDDDSDVDIVIFANGTDELYWLENQGGSFSSKHTLSERLGYVGNIVITDFDQDDDLDIITSNSQLYKNEGQGSFSRSSTFSHYSNQIMDFFDISGNDYSDYVGIDSHLYIQKNIDGKLTPLMVFRHGTRKTSFQVVDLDKDGDNDVVFSSRPADSIWWIENLSNR